MCSKVAKTLRLLGTQAVRYPHMSPPLGEARCGDSPVQGPDLPSPHICNVAVALDVPDNAAGSVPNLDAPPVAGVVNVPDLLPVLVRDV